MNFLIYKKIRKLSSVDVNWNWTSELAGISLTNGSGNRHLYFLIVVYINGNAEEVSDSFELKISKLKASENFSASPNLLNIVSLYYPFFVKRALI
jgi:hypothetical protein